VYYNTTGILVNGILRQRPRICGYARFDTVDGFDPNHLSRMANRVFECADPAVWMGCNKLLFKRVVRSTASLDAFLVITKSEFIGELQVGTENWRSNDTWLLSLSEHKGQQEAMLLMPLLGWIRSSIGRFVLARSEPPRCWAQLLPSGDEQ
jgi:hypothetical protein